MASSRISYQWRCSENGGDNNSAASFAPKTYRKASYLRSSHRRRRRRQGDAAVTNGVALQPVLATVIPSLSDDVQGDLFDFGLSLCQSDDQRRNIHEEIQEIVAFNEETNKRIEEENKAEANIKKQLNYSKNELLKLNAAMSDQLNSASTYSLFLEKDLKHRFETSMVNPSIITEQKKNEEQAQESSITLLDKKASHVISIIQKLYIEEHCMESAGTEAISFKEKCIQLEDFMTVQELRSSLERSREEVRRNKSEVQSNRDAKATRIVEIQQIYDSNGTKAQKVADLTKKLNRAKKTLAEEETKLVKMLELDESEVERLQKTKEEQAAKLEHRKRKIQKCIQQIDNVEAYRERKAVSKQAENHRREKTKEFLLKQGNLKKKLDEQQELERASTARLAMAEKQARISQKKKEENTDIEFKIIVPCEAEMGILAKKKIQIAEKIREASKGFEKVVSQEQQALAAKKNSKKDLENQIKKLKTERQMKLDELEKVWVWMLPF
jgi:hypothetical protein